MSRNNYADLKAKAHAAVNKMTAAEMWEAVERVNAATHPVYPIGSKQPIEFRGTFDEAVERFGDFEPRKPLFEPDRHERSGHRKAYNATLLGTSSSMFNHDDAHRRWVDVKFPEEIRWSDYAGPSFKMHPEEACIPLSGGRSARSVHLGPNPPQHFPKTEYADGTPRWHDFQHSGMKYAGAQTGRQTFSTAAPKSAQPVRDVRVLVHALDNGKTVEEAMKIAEVAPKQRGHHLSAFYTDKPMTVAEVIKVLDKFDPEAKVIAQGCVPLWIYPQKNNRVLFAGPPFPQPEHLTSSVEAFKIQLKCLCTPDFEVVGSNGKPIASFITQITNGTLLITEDVNENVHGSIRVVKKLDYSVKNAEGCKGYTYTPEDNHPFIDNGYKITPPTPPYANGGYVGGDKTVESCRNKFTNLMNFKGVHDAYVPLGPNVVDVLGPQDTTTISRVQFARAMDALWTEIEYQNNLPRRTADEAKDTAGFAALGRRYVRLLEDHWADNPGEVQPEGNVAVPACLHDLRKLATIFVRAMITCGIRPRA